MFGLRKKIGCKNVNSNIDFKKCKIHSLNDYVFMISNKILFVKFYIDGIKYKLSINLRDNIDITFNKDDKTIMFYYDDYIWNYNKKCSKKIQSYFQFNFSNDKILFYKIYSHVLPIKRKYYKKRLFCKK